MTTEALKSPSITNWDATPLVQNTVGEGAPGHIRSVSDTVTVTTGKTAPSTYRLARFPTNAKVKHVWVGVDTTVTTLTADIDVAFSDSTVDGTSAANQGTIPQITAADNKMFGTAVDLKTAGLNDYIKNFANGGMANCNVPMWKALGLTVDPGGFFDIMLKTTATNSGAAIVTGMVDYVL